MKRWARGHSTSKDVQEQQLEIVTFNKYIYKRCILQGQFSRFSWIFEKVLNGVRMVVVGTMKINGGFFGWRGKRGDSDGEIFFRWSLGIMICSISRQGGDLWSLAQNSQNSCFLSKGAGSERSFIAATGSKSISYMWVDGRN